MSTNSVPEPSIGIVRFMDDLVIRIVDEIAVGGIANVAAEVNRLLPMLMTLYVVLWGYRFMAGVASHRSLVVEMIKVTIVLGLVVNFETFNSLVKEPLFTLPDYLASVLVGVQPGLGVVGIMDQVLTSGFALGARYWEAGGLFSSSLGLYLVAIVIWISVIIPTALAAFLVVLSKLMVGILLVLGPLVIMLTLFDRTRGFFDRWLAEIITKSLTVALAIFVPKVLLLYYDGHLREVEAAFASGESMIGSVIVIAFFSVVQVLFYQHVPGLAASLGGGYPVGTPGIEQLVLRTSGRTPGFVYRTLVPPRDSMRRWEHFRMRVGGGMRGLRSGDHIGPDSRGHPVWM